MTDKKTVIKKSVGNNKATKKKQLNPIVILVSLLISKQFLNFGYSQDFLVEEYEAKIKDYLRKKNYEEEQIEKMLNSNKGLIGDCKASYSMHRQGNAKFYSLLQNVNIDDAFAHIISNMPEDFVDACVTDKALGDMLGALVVKKSPEVLGYIASMKKQVADSKKISTPVKVKGI